MITCPFIITPLAISVHPRGASRTIPRQSGLGQQVMRLLADPDATNAQLVELLQNKNPVAVYASADSRFKIMENKQVFFNGERLEPVVEKRLYDCWAEGVPFDHLQAFVTRLYANPSARARSELYKFLEHKNLPITPDGFMLAYKAITWDWKDKHTQTVDNHVGCTPTMKRRDVDDDASRGCSYGYHVGSLEYVSGFASNYGKVGGDRIVLVKVDPADVVSVPLDCDCQKVRTCRYTVIGLFNGPLPAIAVRSEGNPYSSFGDPDADEELDDDNNEDSPKRVIARLLDELIDAVEDLDI